MLRRVSAVAACGVMAVFGAPPAYAATGPAHLFGIPGVYGVRAWGSYLDSGTRAVITICVRDTARDVYGAAAVGLAFDAGYRSHSSVGAVTMGYGHTQCRTMTTQYTSHLVVEALSGYPHGKVREHGRLKRIY